MPHVNVKIFAEGPGVRPEELIPVFHAWIQARDLPELLIDVADYSHVPAGPGVLLIGHEANYSYDQRGSRPGLLYNRKEATGGLAESYASALAACERLENHPALRGRLAFCRKEFEITWNDRALHPNTDEGWREVEPEVKAFCDGRFGPGACTLHRAAGPRERLSVTVRA